jgi:predicted nuclease of predicted toxin-antitoxin system
MAHNVSLANRTRPAGVASLEPFALWFPIQAGPIEVITSKDGKNESSVTMPTMFQPEKLDRDYVVSLWVGADNYKKFASYWKDTQVWQKQPIWEQREATDQELSSYTGGSVQENGDVITENQAEHLVNLCLAKNQEPKEVALTYSQGSTTQIRNLTVAEYKQAVEELKAL